jgi:hypothetical protein
MKKFIPRASFLLAGATAGLVGWYLAGILMGQRRESVGSLVISMASGLAGGWLIWAVWPMAEQRTPADPWDARKEQRPEVFLKRKKRKMFWLLFPAFVGIGCVIEIIDSPTGSGKPPPSPLWRVLFPIVYAALMAWGSSELWALELRRSKKSPRARHQNASDFGQASQRNLPLPSSSWLKTRGHYLVLACGLFVICWAIWTWTGNPDAAIWVGLLGLMGFFTWKYAISRQKNGHSTEL